MDFKIVYNPSVVVNRKSVKSIFQCTLFEVTAAHILHRTETFCGLISFETWFDLLGGQTSYAWGLSAWVFTCR